MGRDGLVVLEDRALMGRGLPEPRGARRTRLRILWGSDQRLINGEEDALVPPLGARNLPGQLRCRLVTPQPVLRVLSSVFAPQSPPGCGTENKSHRARPARLLQPRALQPSPLSIPRGFFPVTKCEAGPLEKQNCPAFLSTMAFIPDFLAGSLPEAFPACVCAPLPTPNLQGTALKPLLPCRASWSSCFPVWRGDAPLPVPSSHTREGLPGAKLVPPGALAPAPWINWFRPAVPAPGSPVLRQPGASQHFDFFSELTAPAAYSSFGLLMSRVLLNEGARRMVLLVPRLCRGGSGQAGTPQGTTAKKKMPVPALHPWKLLTSPRFPAAFSCQNRGTQASGGLCGYAPGGSQTCSSGWGTRR
ncbi:hypothetical protein Anapl_07931 [Anas platyrhynchos]|uniref:Uncharacterized protein n=1 Tax=Anas platyrhynchos TaxID=8839 RepID=R0LB75_ANAPL|nr:hypothetical protein Anapl_07931 [Anas platyrhynchos]